MAQTLGIVFIKNTEKVSGNTTLVLFNALFRLKASDKISLCGFCIVEREYEYRRSRKNSTLCARSFMYRRTSFAGYFLIYRQISRLTVCLKDTIFIELPQLEGSLEGTICTFKLRLASNRSVWIENKRVNKSLNSFYL